MTIFDFHKRFPTEKQQINVRRIVHLVISMLFLTVILIVSQHHNDALIRIIFMVASYTYGPILGLFTFGMFTKREIPQSRRWLVPVIALGIPVLCYILATHSQQWLFGYKFGYELLIVNGLLVFGALVAASRKQCIMQNV